jgi:3-dehydroquinate synthase
MSFDGRTDEPSGTRAILLSYHCHLASPHPGAQHSPMPLTTIEVGRDARRYVVEVADGLLSSLEARLEAHGLGGDRVVVTTPPVWQAVRPRLPRPLARAEPALIPDGERHKRLTTVTRLYDTLLQRGADRATTVVAIGGGVVGDTAGFAAATFLRGLPLVHVPTTLLAQVDSAIGGKVGVNHTEGKNLIGAFHPPRLVSVDPAALATLPRREFRAGLYEVVKYGMIASPELFARLERDPAGLGGRSTPLLVPVIEECCRIKAQVVTRDEHERGERRILNFGHTIGHALEALTAYRRFRHGEAVGYGMMAAAALAVARGALDADSGARLRHLVARMGPLPPVADLEARDALDAVRRDKKIVAGRLHFVLPVAVGQVATVTDVTERELVRAMRGIGLR